MASKTTATILEIQRMSTEDGPGIRTTVFFKGCSLRCRWCHNPESIAAGPQLHWIGSRCIGCRTCLDTCSAGALSLTGDGIRIDRSECVACGQCAAQCPGNALELLGREWSLSELVREVLKDKTYFETSGGGITLSGGEPGLQAGFAEGFMKELRGCGIHIALDTCGLFPTDSLRQLLPHASMVLFDIKTFDADLHRRLTSASNQAILDHLLLMAEYMRDHLYPSRLWIRTPLIPGMTAVDENIFRIGNFIGRHLPDMVERWELCAFNNLCRDKYIRLDRDWELADTPLMSEGELQHFIALAKASGVSPEIVFGTGATRMGDRKQDKNQAAAP